MSSDTLTHFMDFCENTEKSIDTLNKLLTVIKYQKEIYEELFQLYKKLLLKSHQETNDKPVATTTNNVSCCCILTKPKSKLPIDENSNKVIIYHVFYNKDGRGVYTRRYKALQSILDQCKENKELDIHSFTISTLYRDKSILSPEKIDVIQKELMSAKSECEKYCETYYHLK